MMNKSVPKTSVKAPLFKVRRLVLALVFLFVAQGVWGATYYWTGAVYEPGIAYTLNGEQALGLARARHGTTGGDFSRGASQQKILIGIKNKIFVLKNICFRNNFIWN